MINSSTLRPGLLVVLKTTIKGNVSYQKQELDHYQDGDKDVAEWQTKRTIQDKAELEAATKVRGRARTILTSVCAQSAFGLLCPESNVADLEKAIDDARRLASDFNATAAMTRIGIYVMTGRVAADDVEAVKAINSEVRDLIEAMSAGVKAMDVDAIRTAATKAKELESMLSPDAAERVQIAIDTARKVARQLNKAGEQASLVVDEIALAKIDQQRTAFLDLDDVGEAKAPAMEPGAAVDFEPEGPKTIMDATTGLPVTRETVAARFEPQPQLEL